MTRIKPMLASDAPESDTLARLIERRDIFAAPKIDGFRCLIYDGVAYSRTLKPFPNRHVQAVLSGLPHGTDGEVFIGDEHAPDVFSRTQAGVMAREGQPPVGFAAFDNPTLPGGWLDRIAAMQDQGIDAMPGARVLDHAYVESLTDLDGFEADALFKGYEGIILRDSAALYRPGRTISDRAPLLRLKRFATDEARIIDATGDHLTLTAPQWPNAFTVSAGIDRIPTGARRIGETVSFTHFPHGAQAAPRHATLKGIRPALDLIA